MTTKTRTVEAGDAFFWLHFFYGALFLVMLGIVLWFSVSIETKLQLIGDTTSSTYNVEGRLTVVENKVNLIDKAIHENKEKDK